MLFIRSNFQDAMRKRVGIEVFENKILICNIFGDLMIEEVFYDL
jgi:hypothetical protein